MPGFESKDKRSYEMFGNGYSGQDRLMTLGIFRETYATERKSRSGSEFKLLKTWRSDVKESKQPIFTMSQTIQILRLGTLVKLKEHR